MKVGLVHNTLNSCGGGELLSLTIAKTLKEKGYKITYYTAQKTDWDFVKQVLNVDFKPDFEKYFFPMKIPCFGIYQRLLLGFFSQAVRECDLVINTHGDVMPFVKADITYMHYPTFSLWYESPVNVKYLKSTFWKTYFIPYRKFQETLVNKFSGLILTNSTFSAKAVEKFLKRKPYIVYPPVNVKNYLKHSFEKENSIVSLGRFSPEKRYEEVLKIASCLPSLEFYIIGSVTNKLNKNYYDKLLEIIEKKKLNNVFLLANLSFKDKVKVLGKAKVYLHTMVNEHFGIAVVEAMASGCIPVVHKSGGPWEDILEKKQGLYGYAFENTQEAVKYIRKVIENYEVCEKIRKRNLKHVSKFDKKVFQKKILKIVKTFEAKLNVL